MHSAMFSKRYVVLTKGFFPVDGWEVCWLGGEFGGFFEESRRLTTYTVIRKRSDHFAKLSTRNIAPYQISMRGNAHN